MRAFTNGSGEILIAMTYPEFELLSQIAEYSASGIGCHRGAEYVSHQLCKIGNSKILSEAIHEVEVKEEKEAKARSSAKRRDVD